MNNSHIIRTDPNWFYNLEKTLPTGLVVFPRKDTNNLHNIQQGDRLYFLRKKTSLYPHIALLGMATFKYYKIYTLNDLWNNYGTSTGFTTLNELIFGFSSSSISSSTKVGCVFLDNMVSFKKDIFLSNCGINFPKQIQSRKKISLVEENLILNQVNSCALNSLKKSNPLGYNVVVTTTTRVNQDIFRSDLLSHYGKCLICGITNPKLLRASHSKSWKESTPSEKTDPMNGLLLCCNHDSLYDNHLISFDAGGKILISKTLIKNDLIQLGLSSSIQLSLPPAALNFISFHNKKFHEKEKKRNRKNP